MRPGEDPKDCWQTPRELAQNLTEEFGCTWDAACEPHNCLFPNQVLSIENALTIYGTWNGLDWLRRGANVFGHRVGTAWVNPPYSNITPWVEAAIWRAQYLQATTVMLLPANRMGRKWLGDAINSGVLMELSLFCGRIRFKPPAGVEESSPRFDNMLLVFGGPAPTEMKVTSRHPVTGKLHVTSIGSVA